MNVHELCYNYAVVACGWTVQRPMECLGEHTVCQPTHCARSSWSTINNPRLHSTLTSYRSVGSFRLNHDIVLFNGVDDVLAHIEIHAFHRVVFIRRSIRNFVRLCDSGVVAYSSYHIMRIFNVGAPEGLLNSVDNHGLELVNRHRNRSRLLSFPSHLLIRVRQQSRIDFVWIARGIWRRCRRTDSRTHEGRLSWHGKACGHWRSSNGHLRHTRGSI